MREQRLIQKVKWLVEDYSFNQPFSIYLREHFRKHPEMGARDRRETRGWSFNLFRIGPNLIDLSFEKRLSIACFLCSNTIYPSLSYLLKTHSEFSETDLIKPLEQKIQIVQEKFPSFKTDTIFQMADFLSPQIESKELFLSFLHKPKVWIRIRKKYREDILKELKEKTISYSSDDDPLIFSFPADVSLEKTDAYQKGFFEIQDKFSQLTKQFFQPKPNEYWWDACAGAGGKSLLLIEESSDLKIFATDIRENILNNYKERLRKSGFKFSETEVLDISMPLMNLSDRKFDGIITDVPCSGSGTWSRSPEWLQNDIDKRLTEHFIPLQRKIVTNVLPYLKEGFPLIFITCSVFKKENEENIEFFIKNLPLKLEKSAYLEGYKSGGDTLFVARLSKI